MSSLLPTENIHTLSVTSDNVHDSQMAVHVRMRVEHETFNFCSKNFNILSDEFRQSV